MTVTDRLAVATLNTRGVPITGSRLADRYAVIAGSFEACDVDAVNFQEVLTYHHLRLLTRRMPSYRHVSFRPSAAGPAGGLATLSRLPVAGSGYHRFGVRLDVAGLPWLTRFLAPMKGALVTTLAAAEICLVNTHPTANWDGDWSESNRFYPIHKAQLATLARVIGDLPRPVVVCGDFNVASDSAFYSDFIAATGLADAFGGQCPPTFRAEFLSPGSSPHCIDFILVAGPIKVEAAQLLLAAKQPLPGGPAYVSDHIGRRHRRALSRPGRAPHRGRHRGQPGHAGRRRADLLHRRDTIERLCDRASWKLIMVTGRVSSCGCPGMSQMLMPPMFHLITCSASNPGSIQKTRRARHPG